GPGYARLRSHPKLQKATNPSGHRMKNFFSDGRRELTPARYAVDPTTRPEHRLRLMLQSVHAPPHTGFGLRVRRRSHTRQHRTGTPPSQARLLRRRTDLDHGPRSQNRATSDYAG